MRSSCAAGWSLAIGTSLASVAHAAPVTVWLSDTVPDERMREKADLQTGGTLHLTQVDLRFAPTPATSDDDAALEGLEAAWDRGREVWDEFDVELSIASDLENAVRAIGLVRSEDDREAIAQALLFQGTAAARAFSPEAFGTDPQAAELRYDAAGTPVPLAWVRAFGLTGEKAQRGDLVDGTGWLDWQRYGGAIAALPTAKLEVPEGVGEVWVDGAPLAPGVHELHAGRHWIHLVRAGVIHGRSVLDVAPSQTYALPTDVDADDLGTTRARVLEGKRTGFPDDVVAALRRIEAHYGGPLYLGTVDGTRPLLVPLDGAAVLKDDRLVTFVLFADVGGGIVGSSLFDQRATYEAVIGLDGDVADASGTVTGGKPGDVQIAGAAMASLGVELGVSYFAAALGLDGVMTPGRSIDYVLEPPGDDADSGHAAFFPHAWLGVGAYALRPTKPAPTLAVLGTIAYAAPTHMVYGGRIVAGFPIDDRPTWVRLTAGGGYGPDSFRDDTTRDPLFTAWLRLGFGSRP